MKYFSNLFDALPEDAEDELKRRYDKLDKQFNAGVYRKPGIPIETSWKFDQRVHDDLNELGEAIGKRFAIMAPISYYGKEANGENARYLHAITLDLDGVGIKQLKTLVAFINAEVIPVPTYLVNSGHGLHLYYVLDKPIPLYKYVRKPISKLKNALINEIWNPRTSTITNRKDYQPCLQMYRVVGSQTKLGAGYVATAYKVGGHTNLETLNKYLTDQLIEGIELPLENYRPKGKSGHNLEYWKEHNPDWYKRRILGEVDDKPKGRFPWLYEKFKLRMQRAFHVGNRYYCMCVLFADASQCGIPYSEVYEYACNQIDFFNIGVEDEKNLFTKEDIDCAAKYYVTDFGHFMSLERIEAMTGIEFPRNKRNGRDRDTHTKKYIPFLRSAGEARDTRFGAEDGNKSGRSSAEQVVRDYLTEHPNAKKSEVIKGTGLSKPTVYKWYDKIKKEEM